MRRFASQVETEETLGAELLKTKSESPEDVERLSSLHFQLSRLHLKQWNLQKATKVLVSLKELLQSKAPSNYASLGECFFQLGEVYYNLQDAGSAKKYYEESLTAFQATSNPASGLNIAKAYYGLGNTFQSIASFPEALSCFQHALELADSAGPQKDNLLSLVNQGFASIYRVQNKLEKAVEHAQKALDLVTEKADRSSSEIYADAHECMGDVLMSKRDLREAVDAYSRAVRLKKVLFPSKHPEIGKTLGKLGVAFIASNRHQDAIPLFQEKLSIDKQVFGELHLSVADDYNDLGFAHVRLRQIDEAETAYSNELSVLEKLPESDIKRLASVHLNLLSVKVNKKETKEAMTHGIKAADLLKRQEGQQKEQLSYVLGQLSDLYLQEKDMVQALKSQEESLRIKQEIYPPGHVEIGKSLISLGQIKGMSNDPKTAETYITQGVAILRQTLKPDDASLGIAFAKQGTAYASNGNLESAILSYREAVHLFRKVIPMASTSTVTTSLHLISLLVATKKYYEAEAVYRRIIADIEQAEKQTQFEFPKLIKSLYTVLQMQEKSAECEALMKKYPDHFAR